MAAEAVVDLDSTRLYVFTIVLSNGNLSIFIETKTVSFEYWTTKSVRYFNRVPILTFKSESPPAVRKLIGEMIDDRLIGTVNHLGVSTGGRYVNLGFLFHDGTEIEIKLDRTN